MYKRTLKLPKNSFFLFGPRGTGKTTWLRSQLPDAKWFDMLKTSEYLRLLQNPDMLRMEVEALPKPSWVVIDEVQKLPQLLNEVHALIFEHGDDYLFALSGSSARKIRRLDANLLAGRVINRRFFPFTGEELSYQFDMEHVLKFGLLPNVVVKPDIAIDILEAYVVNYIEQEIVQEALVKNIGSFARFLEIAALCNGRVINISNIARDSGVARPTVERFFDVLNSTLIGAWVPAWRPRIKVKEVSHPKFYFFDTGVVRALTKRLRETLDSTERGMLLETLILHELRSYINTSNCGGEIYYWGTPSGQEVDFIWQRGEINVGFEIKSSLEWRRNYSTVLKNLLHSKKCNKAYGVYMGEQLLADGPVTVLPIRQFMQRLHNHEILG